MFMCPVLHTHLFTVSMLMCAHQPDKYTFTATPVAAVARAHAHVEHCVLVLG